MIPKKFGVLVVDGDYLAYLAAFVTQGSVYTVVNKEGEVIVSKPSLESCTKYCEKAGIDIADCEVTKDVIVHKNWESIAKATVANKIRKWKAATGTSRVLIAMGGLTNFRDRLNLFQKYKDRPPSNKPLKLKEVRALILELYSCIVSDDCEADDIIAMYQYKGHLDGSYIVATEDKDAKQTPGYMFNPRTEEIRCCTGFGKIELITKMSSSMKKTYKIDGFGRCFFYYQLVVGDPVDTYHPFPKVISAYKFSNDFASITNDLEAWAYVVNLYKQHYGDVTEWVNWRGETVKGTWVDILQVYVDVVHMMRTPNDRLNVKEILTKFGLL